MNYVQRNLSQIMVGQNKNTIEDNFIPFALPEIGEEECKAVLEVLKSGWVTTGKVSKNFETEFSHFLGGNLYSIALNSATMGLQIALRICEVKAGDEVITSPYTFSATAMSIIHCGAKPVFVDINPVTLNIDPSQIEKAITTRTKAIIPVHFAGLPANMTEILKLAKKYNLRVIEDAAHAFPARHNNQLIGTLDSDATVYSFYATKTITSGEGGMIVVRNKEWAKTAEALRLHGISRDVFDRYIGKEADWHYDIIVDGYKCNLTDIAAAIGQEQLKKAEKFLEKRRYIASVYNEEFKNLPVILPFPGNESDQHSWHLYVIQIRHSKITRDQFIDRMKRKYNIGCSVHFRPLHLHTYWKNLLNHEPQDFLNAYTAYKNVVSLPIYTKMDDTDIYRVVAAVKEILG